MKIRKTKDAEQDWFHTWIEEHLKKESETWAENNEKFWVAKQARQAENERLFNLWCGLPVGTLDTDLTVEPLRKIMECPYGE